MINSLAVLFASLAVVSATVFSYDNSSSCVTSTGYGYCGFNEWSTLNAACGITTNASPIDIAFPDVVYDYGFQGPTSHVASDGCSAYSIGFDETLYLDLSSTCQSITAEYDSSTYTLSRVNFHSPSQHTFGGGYYSGEVELIHTNTAGGLLVLSVLLDAPAVTIPGGNNVFFDTLRDNYYNSLGAVINPLELTPGSKAMYHYTGSLTQPPCTQAVDHFLFVEPVLVSHADIEAIRGLESGFLSAVVGTANTNGGNNRPTQPLGSRQVIYFNNEILPTAHPTAAPTKIPTASPTTYQQRPEEPEPRPELRRSSSEKVMLGVILGSLSLGATGLIALFLGWMWLRYGCSDIKAEARKLKGGEVELAATNNDEVAAEE